MKVTLKPIMLFTLAAMLIPASAMGQSGGGSIFKVVPTPNKGFNSGFQAASAFSPTDIWAVGISAAHFDGTTWTAFPEAEIKGKVTNLAGVVDISPTLAWAGGTVNAGAANPGQVIEQWDGTQWSVFPGPTFAKNDVPSINAMTSTSANDIWAIGSLLGDDLQKLFFLFEHWDGTAWTATTQTSGDAFLFGASADATNDAWAVGFTGPENDTSQTLAMHWDGTSWKTVATPSVGSGANQLNSVLALAPNDVWAVGFSTPVPPPQQAASLTLIEHFDGTSWQVVPSPNVGPNSIFQSNRLFGLTANSANDVWAFGSFVAANGSEHQLTLILHWNGTDWTIVPSPDPTKGNFLSDVLFAGVVPSPGNVWIFGIELESPRMATLAIHTATGDSF